MLNKFFACNSSVFNGIEKPVIPRFEDSIISPLERKVATRLFKFLAPHIIYSFRVVLIHSYPKRYSVQLLHSRRIITPPIVIRSSSVYIVGFTRHCRSARNELIAVRINKFNHSISIFNLFRNFLSQQYHPASPRPKRSFLSRLPS